MISNNTQNTIEAAIQATYEASKQITTPDHVACLIAELASSMQTLPPDGIIDLPPEFEKPGVYFFEVKFPYQTKEELEAFGESWGRIRAAGLPKSLPRYYPTRAENHHVRISRHRDR